MTTSRFPEITDELLSAYIDNAVTDSERALVERAAGEEAAIAWRLSTLRETVQLLRALPMLQASRSFALTPDLVRQSKAEPAPAGVAIPRQRTAQPGWWEQLRARWREFWQTGNPAWRNALATSMAALLVLLMLPALLREPTRQDSAPAPAAMMLANDASARTLPEAAPAATTAAKSPEADSPAANVTEVTGVTASAASAAQLAATSPAAGGGALLQATAPAAAEGVTVRTIPRGDDTADPLAAAAAPVEDAASAAEAAQAAPLSLPTSGALAAAAPVAEMREEEAAAYAQSEVMPLAAAPAAEHPAAAPVSVLNAPPSPAARVEATPTAIATQSVATQSVATQSVATQSVAFAAPDAPLSTAPSPVVSDATIPSLLLQLIPWLQAGALAAVGASGFLWWRSRRLH